MTVTMHKNLQVLYSVVLLKKPPIFGYELTVKVYSKLQDIRSFIRSWSLKRYSTVFACAGKSNTRGRL